MKKILDVEHVVNGFSLSGDMRINAVEYVTLSRPDRASKGVFWMSGTIELVTVASAIHNEPRT